ncbi:MAG: HEAT repeat domain-containing protein, partial [Planctomycetes bacterium]|nr:HEAT repeat domain-containing protein [Planctomycetota bacterium]
CLGRLGDDAATAHLLEHLDDPDLRGPAAQALGELGLAGHAEAAIEPLSRAVEDASSSDAFARAEATKALGSVARGHPGAGVDALCKALRLDPSSTVRAAAARALGTVSADPERIRPPLLAALDDAEAVVRLDVIESLRGLPALHAAATPRLIALLDDPQDAVVEAAAEALEELAPPSALAPLRALSEDSARSQQVRQAARRAALRLERSAPNAR